MADTATDSKKTPGTSETRTDSGDLTLTLCYPLETKEYVVEWVRVLSPTGEFIIGPDHMPLLSVVSIGEESIMYKTNHGEESVAFSVSGIVTVEGNIITALVP